MNDYIYLSLNDEGKSFRSINRSEVLDWYNLYNGVKVERYTKDLFPIHEIIIDGMGINTDLVRKDEDILNQTSKALRKAISKYDKCHTKQVSIKLNTETDKDILDFLDQCENKQGLIKELIRDYIKDTKIRN